MQTQYELARIHGAARDIRIGDVISGQDRDSVPRKGTVREIQAGTKWVHVTLELGDGSTEPRRTFAPESPTFITRRVLTAEYKAAEMAAFTLTRLPVKYAAVVDGIAKTRQKIANSLDRGYCAETIAWHAEDLHASETHLEILVHLANTMADMGTWEVEVALAKMNDWLVNKASYNRPTSSDSLSRALNLAAQEAVFEILTSGIWFQ